MEFLTVNWKTLAILCLLGAGTASASSLKEWRSRTVYQILTDRFARSDGSTSAPCNVVDGRYCGGSWKGITESLDYIQGMHFDAIWISPIVSQIPEATVDGEAYTAYWANDLYALNPHFGTKSELEELVSEVHSRGMLLMMDVVVNHMAFAGNGRRVDYTTFNPFNDKKYFHGYCRVHGNTNQTEVETCWLGSDTVALADLKTEDKTVRAMLGDWINELVSNYSIDGLRIDTAVNVEPGFFPDFVDAAGVFATGETMQGDNLYVCQWGDAIGSILNYPIYYPLIRAFSNERGSINDLVTTMYTMHDNCADPTAFGSFSENHDVERFADLTNDTALAKNILAFTVLSDGIPIIYQGQEQHMSGGVSPYTNRSPLWTTGYDRSAELYRHIADLVLARQLFVLAGEDYTTYAAEVIYHDYHSMAMRKGKNGKQVITVLNNNGESSDDFDLEIEGHELRPGTELTEILSCTNLTVTEAGILKVRIDGGRPRVLYPAEYMHYSGLCGMDSPLPKPSATTTAVPTSPLETASSETSDSGTAHHARARVGFTVLAAICSLLSQLVGAC